MNYIEVGKIVNTHALKGEVKIKSFTTFDRFKEEKTLYVGEEKKELKVKKHRKDENYDYCIFYDYEDINLILPYKNKSLYIKESDLEELEENEYYIKDLIGKEVYNENNNCIGIVKYVSEYPANYMLEVEKENKKIVLIPFRKEFVLEVKDIIIIHEIEGLI